MFDVQVTKVPAALAGTFVFHNVYDVQVEKMLVELMARFSETGRRDGRLMYEVATRMENSAAGCSLTRDCVARRSAHAEFVQDLVQSPRRNEVNRFATVLRGEFVSGATTIIQAVCGAYE